MTKLHKRATERHRGAERLRRKAEATARRIEMTEATREAFNQGYRKAEEGIKALIPSQFQAEVWRRFSEMVAREVFKEAYEKAGPEIAHYSRMVAERAIQGWGHMPDHAITGLISHIKPEDYIRTTLRIDNIRLGFQVSGFDLAAFRREEPKV